MQTLITLCFLIIAMAPYTNAVAQERSTNPPADNTAINAELKLPNNRLEPGSDKQLIDGNNARLGIGLGYANATVLPNTDNKFNDGRKLSLGFGLSTDYELAPYFAITARADLLISFGYTLFTVIDTSLSASATVGFTIGKLRQPGQLYLSATLGPGFAVIGDRGLDDEGEQDCLLCTSKEGGSSAGLATRIAIGRTGKLGQRVELVYMRTGGNGNNRSYTNNEEAFIDTVLIQFSAIPIDSKTSSSF